MSTLRFEKDLAKHPLHYFVLLCLQLAGLWAIFWFNYVPTWQFLSVLYMAVVYIVWGVIHHKIHKTLHIKIILEYVVVASLAVILFGSIILR